MNSFGAFQLGGIGLVNAKRTQLWTPAQLSVAARFWGNESSTIDETGHSGFTLLWSNISSGGVSDMGNTDAAGSGDFPAVVAGGLASKRTLQFDGSDDRHWLTGTTLDEFRNIANSWLAIVVKKTTLDGAATIRPVISSDAASAGVARFSFYFGHTTGSINNVPHLRARRADGDTTGVLQAASAIPDTNFHVYLVTMDYANRTGTIYVDGSQSSQNTTLTSAGAATSNTASIHKPSLAMQSNGVFPNDIEVAELLIGRSGLPSSTEIDKIHGYLHHRWGLANNLPGGHVYKLAPP